ncbi:hypothetical protein BHE74_00030128 [Ensete ventricosum]|nr:hypothetical protein GW17_00005791 [Ensete ventricosum]RWW62727.1 hypothetical protein BHE74_00030128 [Ensete ventricosum]RZS00374.1 hypothetical protein BHM03_00030082 [Ensete ventricosum]
MAPGTSSAAGSEEAKVNGEGDDEALVARAQKLIAKIVDTQDNPNPRLLHALASILEAQESRFVPYFVILITGDPRVSVHGVGPGLEHLGCWVE